MRWIGYIVPLFFLTPAALEAQPQGAAHQRSEAPPQADITNGVVHARFYLPDTANGYYRATRFDWSGVMPVLEFGGHQYCGQWNPIYGPTVNDAIVGPVESFWPLGYDRAPAGGTFVQVGVGVLQRPDTAAYTSFRYYPIKDAGGWRVETSGNRIEFRQCIDDTAYSYEYTKTITLPEGKPELVITHLLRNTGRQTIETNVFDHNFFVVDGHGLEPGFALRFRFPLQASAMRGSQDLTTIAGDSIVIRRPFVGRESVFAVLKGYDSTAADYDFRLENPLTGAALRIRGDRPLVRLVYWGYHNTLCPEPYIHIKVEPGETFRWTLTYSFERR